MKDTSGGGHGASPRVYIYPPSTRPRNTVASNAGRCCPGRRSCSPRLCVYGCVFIIGIYIPLNLIFSITATPRPTPKIPVRSLDLKNTESLAVEVSNLVPGAEGKVNVVLSLDIHDLLRFMDKLVSPTGAPTTNAMPRNTSIVLHNPSLCDNQRLDWLVYVHSSPGNDERRAQLRRTWANVNLFKNLNFRVVFLLGQTNDLAVRVKVKNEFKTHQDLVIGDFTDHYKNLTLKGIMGLHWASTYCPNAPIVIKADDDAFVNIFEVIRILADYKSQEKLVVCPLWKESTMPILRDPKKCMKWCVKYTEFPGKTHFPQYCAGLTYILSNQMAKDMYEASFSTPFFWIDDVYVTGLLTSKVKDVGYVNLIKNFTLKENVALEQYENLSQTPTINFVHIKKIENFQKFWKLTLDRLRPTDLLMLREDVLREFTDIWMKQRMVTEKP